MSIFLALLIPTGLILTGIPESFSKIPSAIEPAYTQAVLAFNAKQYSDALATLKEVEAQAPDAPEILELESLCLKALGRHQETASLYLRLLSLQRKLGASESVLAPYRFELGVIALRQSKFAEARAAFQSSLKANFNPEASAFLLGLTEHKLNRLPEAESAFARATEGEDPRFTAPAYLSLGQIHLQSAYLAGAADAWVHAQDSALEWLKTEDISAADQKAATEIAAQAVRSLEPFNRFGLFGNATLLTAYDSNVLSLPASATDTAATNRSSFKIQFQGGGGIMSSPLKWAQATASYRTSVNLNLNAAAYSGQFWSHIGSLHLTARPLSRFRFGLRGEGALTLQSQKESESTSAMFRPFSAGFTTAGFAQWEWAKRWIHQTEVFFTPQNFYADASTPVGNRRSGLTWGLRTSLNFDRQNRWFNPLIDLHYASQQTAGTEFDVTTAGLLLANTFNPRDRFRIATSASLDFSSFPNRIPTTRTDWLVSAGLNPSFRLIGSLSLLGEFRYTRNLSSLTDLYGYNRWVTSIGVSYAL